MGILEKINEDILDYDNGFNVFFEKLYVYLVLPVSCLHIFHRCYLPLILNHWFSYPDDTKFPDANSSWGFFYTFFYNFFHPSMELAKYYNECKEWNAVWYLLGMGPGWLLLYTIIYVLACSVLYWIFFNLFFGGLIEGYSSPFKK